MISQSLVWLKFTKKTDNNKIGQNVEKWDPRIFLVGTLYGANALEISLAISQNVKHGVIV